MFEGIKKNLSNGIRLVKFLIDDYNQYKSEEIQMQQQSSLIILENMRKLEEEIEKQKLEDEKQLKENVKYDENTGKYYFETTSEYNGVPHTFYYSEGTEDGCRSGARFQLVRANLYKNFGIC